MQPEREVDPPSSIRHQSHLMLIVEIHAETAANHHERWGFGAVFLDGLVYEKGA